MLNKTVLKYTLLSDRASNIPEETVRFFQGTTEYREYISKEIDRIYKLSPEAAFAKLLLITPKDAKEAAFKKAIIKSVAMEYVK